MEPAPLKKGRQSALRIAAIYAAFGAAWVSISEGLANFLAWKMADAVMDSLFIAASSVTLYYLIITSLAKERRMEESLRQARARTESVLASVADTHILFDRQWRYLYVNDAAARPHRQRPVAAVPGKTGRHTGGHGGAGRKHQPDRQGAHGHVAAPGAR